ncbi:MAG: hypothetical protein ACFFDF_03780 [Candidatus Odinarchaeota archaeon]
MIRENKNIIKGETLYLGCLGIQKNFIYIYLLNKNYYHLRYIMKYEELFNTQPYKEYISKEELIKKIDEYIDRKIC